MRATLLLALTLCLAATVQAERKTFTDLKVSNVNALSNT